MTIKTYSIDPNDALGMGVILTLNFADGSVTSIPCQNFATAAYFVRNWSNENVRKMAASWAS